MEALLQKEKKYLNFLMIISSILWLLLIVGTLGIGLIYIFIFYVFFLFTQSGLIAWLKGNAVEINSTQFADLDGLINECCQKLQMPRPQCYIMNGNGVLNAFATRFLKRNYVVLLSDVVDAFEAQPEILRFYIGHELGHIKQDHIFKFIYVAPTLFLPLAYPAYRRSCEYVCDQFGRLCCNSNEEAVSGLLLLMSGLKRWKSTSPAALQKQLDDSFGFWVSYHELTSNYPWLSKRVSTLQNNQQQNFKPHHTLALLLGFLTPGFLPGSLFPLYFIYFGIIFAVMISLMLSVKNLKNNLLPPANIAQNTYSATQEEKVDPKHWLNTMTAKTIDMPDDFKVLPNTGIAASALGRFSFNEDIYYSYISAFSNKEEATLEDYMKMLEDKKIYSADPKSITYTDYQGQRLLTFKTKTFESEPSSKLTQTITVWKTKNYYWELYSDYDLKDADSEKKHQHLFKLIFDSTIE